MSWKNDSIWALWNMVGFLVFWLGCGCCHIKHSKRKTTSSLGSGKVLFPGGSDGKASVYNAGDLGSIPGSGRSPGEGNGNPLQYYCLENPMDRGA